MLKAKNYKVSLYQVKKWLQDQDSYSLHRPNRTKFKRQKVIADGLDALWDTDLAGVGNLAKFNDSIRFFWW